MRSRTVLLLALMILLVSCSKAEFTVSSVKTQPYVCSDSRMGLSVYVRTSEAEENSVQFFLSAPGGNLSWSFGARKLELDGDDYLGSSDICMPLGTALPEGVWSLEIMYKDGSKVSRTFEVDYGDVEAALDRYSEDEIGGAWYDSAENLTVLPSGKPSDNPSDLSE